VREREVRRPNRREERVTASEARSEPKPSEGTRPKTIPVVRFAPSPTGHLHVGGARTALFNWALAKRLGGRFVLRIEDTDVLRSTDEAVAGILEDLAWLGIHWDEGPERDGIGGDPRGVGPFFQSQRLALYREAVDALIARDLAYPAFETPEELEAMRRKAQAASGAFRYVRPAGWDRAVALARMQREPHVVRFRWPHEPITVRDEILGSVDFPADFVDDFVILKRDGFPTYHLGVVVDDERMGVTHVLRGQEHLNNTPRHVALQRALGQHEPRWAHLPLIQNPDGSKMSKRDAAKLVEERLPAGDPRRGEPWSPDALRDVAARLGVELPAITVEDFRRAGYLPEVILNFLALLGWSPGEKLPDGRDLERFDTAYLAAHFSLDRVGRGNARFDRAKLLAFSQAALGALSDAEWLAHWQGWCERYAPEARAKLADPARAHAFAAAVRPRARTLAEPTAPGGPGGFALVADDAFAYDPKAVEKHLAKGTPPGLALLEGARLVLAGLAEPSPEAIEAALSAFAAERGVKLGAVAQALRVAVTGAAASPPLGLTLAMLGRASALARVERCLRECGAER
jgi:glutamyl/glutaminyl-tRNA synthetase